MSAVGVDADDNAAFARLGPDVGAPVAVDHHVAEVGGGQCRDVGDDLDGVAVIAQDLTALCLLYT